MPFGIHFIEWYQREFGKLPTGNNDADEALNKAFYAGFDAGYKDCESDRKIEAEWDLA